MVGLLPFVSFSQELFEKVFDEHHRYRVLESIALSDEIVVYAVVSRENTPYGSSGEIFHVVATDRRGNTIWKHEFSSARFGAGMRLLEDSTLFAYTINRICTDVVDNYVEFRAYHISRFGIIEAQKAVEGYLDSQSHVFYSPNRKAVFHPDSSYSFVADRQIIHVQRNDFMEEIPCPWIRSWEEKIDFFNLTSYGNYHLGVSNNLYLVNSSGEALDSLVFEGQPEFIILESGHSAVILGNQQTVLDDSLRQLSNFVVPELTQLSEIKFFSGGYAALGEANGRLRLVYVDTVDQVVRSLDFESGEFRPAEIVLLDSVLVLGGIAEFHRGSAFVIKNVRISDFATMIPAKNLQVVSVVPMGIMAHPVHQYTNAWFSTLVKLDIAIENTGEDTISSFTLKVYFIGDGYDMSVAGSYSC